MEKENNADIIIYQDAEGNAKIDVKVENETVWLTQKQIAGLFGVDRSVVTKHIKSVLDIGELKRDLVCAIFAHTAEDGKTYNTTYYNLDMIISIGYRVNSIMAVRFRQWATNILREYLIKGFAMDDERLKNARGDYFDELLERIRDIRSSEKVFYRKILEIYATSIDYDKNTDTSREFFATVQNKIHWAVHGHTAAELVFERACAEKDFMGLTTSKGKIKKNEVKIAKNYLSKEELNILNRIVNMYLEYAELQAMNKSPMYMSDWIDKLDDFLKMTNRNILSHKGKISKLEAENKALAEYLKYNYRIENNNLSEVEKHFLENAEKINKRVKTIKKS
jgi:hypothetical protein